MACKWGSALLDARLRACILTYPRTPSCNPLGKALLEALWHPREILRARGMSTPGIKEGRLRGPHASAALHTMCLNTVRQGCCKARHCQRG